MANRYGEAALLAVRMETYDKALTPLERWNDAVQKLYPTSPFSLSAITVAAVPGGR